jgi:hypothetical protein
MIKLTVCLQILAASECMTQAMNLNEKSSVYVYMKNTVRKITMKLLLPLPSKFWLFQKTINQHIMIGSDGIK